MHLSSALSLVPHNPAYCLILTRLLRFLHTRILLVGGSNLVPGIFTSSFQLVHK